MGYPSPSQSIGIMQLAENLEVIYGAQVLRSKILSRKDLGLIDQIPAYTAFALAMSKAVDIVRKDRCHIGM